jgi:hypothetical protein
MRSLATLLIVAAAVLVFAVPEAAAAGRRRWIDRGHVRSNYVESGPVHRAPPLDPRAVYPQYQGGFHSRSLQNIGVPTGDIGIRGNGFMMNPW